MFSSPGDVGYKKIQLLSISGSSPSFTIFESTSILAVSQITSAQPHCISMARDVTNPNCPQVSLLLSAAMNAILGLCMDMDTGKKDIFADTSEASEVQLNAVEFRNYRTQCCSFRGMGASIPVSSGSIPVSSAGQAWEGSFLAVSKPIFASTY